ncbi:18448_t:CDS:2, partial [Gigaspora rosea]
TLESQDCSLADCFVGLVRLGMAIKRLPENDYHTFHIVWAQGAFQCILLVADNFYKKIGKTQKERRMLMSQLRSYRCCAVPIDIPFADNESPTVCDEVQNDEFLEEEMLKIEELLNIDVADFTNDLGEIVFTANFGSFEEEDSNIQNNDVESNVDEDNWNPEIEAES